MNENDLDILRLSGRGYCCAQIVVKLALELQGHDNPGLVGAMSGLCFGISGSGTCGALAGAACLVGYYGGKGDDAGENDERLVQMLQELQEWFESYCRPHFSGISCTDIVGDKKDTVVCGDLVGRCYEKSMTLLVENGFNPEEDNGR